MDGTAGGKVNRDFVCLCSDASAAAAWDRGVLVRVVEQRRAVSQRWLVLGNDMQ
jgi:hypothetical protein